jgi:hypothetical protein
MVRAIMAGRKSQTRRVLRPQPDFRGGQGDWLDPECWGWENAYGEHVAVTEIAPNAYQPGDRLWVREAFIGAAGYDRIPPSKWGNKPIWFCADGEPDRAVWWHLSKRARPSIHMPKAYARIWLDVTAVRVERLRDISEDGAIAEGCRPFFDHDNLVMEPSPNGGSLPMAPLRGPVDAYRTLWDSLNAKRPGCSWEANPWVAVVTFERSQ